MEEAVLISKKDLEKVLFSVINKALKLHSLGNNYNNVQEDLPLNVEQAAEITGLTTHTIYQLTSKKIIPFHKTGKKLAFFRPELINWIKEYNESK